MSELWAHTLGGRWIGRTALTLCLLSTSCARTTMNTYRDPGSVGRQPFTRLAIFAIVGDLGERQRVEAAGVQRVQERTEASAVRAIDILPPTRQLPPEQAAAELDRFGIDGVLFVILTNAYVDVYQMPG